MKARLILIVVGAFAGALSTGAQAAGIAPPQLQLMALERYTAGGQEWVRYVYDVTNKAAYPAELFVAAPDLPPCGLNANASRTWIDIYDRGGKRIYGFCALKSPDQLGRIWFAARLGTPPPGAIYIEITDRKTQARARSNLAVTSFSPCAPPGS